MLSNLLSYLSISIMLAPLLGLVGILAAFALNKRYSEKRVTGIVAVTLGVSFAASLAVAALMAIFSVSAVQIAEVTLFGHQVISLGLDWLSLPFVLVTTLLSWLVAVFSKPYLHRERGHFRFFFLLLLFVSAMIVVFAAQTLQSVFVGWEIVGITSAFLISFFYSDRKTVRNALSAFFAYRISDMGLVAALVLSHGLTGSRFVSLGGDLQGTPTIHGAGSLAFVIAILFACLGKSSQYPFVRWLPRAMEGPTPSSAIFYGAISVHAGVYLMLRTLLSTEPHTEIAVLLVVVGLVTSLYATVLGRIQSDVKSSLAYASMAQVGLMFFEMGLGLRGFVVLHFVGHAMLRTYQLLHAPAAFQRHESFERLEMAPLQSPGATFDRLIPSRVQYSLYRVALRETTYGTSHTFGLRAALAYLSEEARRMEHSLSVLFTEGCRKIVLVSSPRGAKTATLSSESPVALSTTVNSR